VAGEETQQETTEETNGQSNGGTGHKTAVRAAAIAAATGATAFAAKKALSGRDQSQEGKEKKQRSSSAGDDDSMLSAMIESGWDAARDSLLPFAEEAAGAAGEWVARSTPEIVSETLVPRFIRGFEKARAASDDDAGEDEQS
jgi:hypothetical protein